MLSWLSWLSEIFKGSDGHWDWTRIGAVIAATAAAIAAAIKGAWEVFKFRAEPKRADKNKGGETLDAERRPLYYRRIKSISDILEYRYYTLNARFKWWAAGWIGLLALPIIFPRSPVAWVAVPVSFLGFFSPLVISLIFMVPQFLIKRSSSDHGSPIREQIDYDLFDSLKNVLPSKKEQQYGFKTYVRPSQRNDSDAPVVLSETLNKDCMANPEWDININRLPKHTSYNQIISILTCRSAVLMDYMFAKFSSSFLSINPLTNDRKIGFRSPIIEGAQSIDIFETDYFTGLCTEGLTTKNLVKTIAGHRVVLYKAPDYCPLECKNGRAIRLLDFNDTSKPCSMQGAIEVIAISNDRNLRLAIQSNTAQYSQGTRAPLASGSMDWEDQEDCKTLKQLIIKAAYRELIEEWGKKHPTLPPVRVKEDKIQPIGFFRMPHRGGKPQFVVFAQLENNDQDLRPDPAEVERAEEGEHARACFSVPDLASLRGAVTQMLEGGGTYRDSVPLYGALLCLEHAIAHHPEVICNVAGYEE